MTELAELYKLHDMIFGCFFSSWILMIVCTFLIVSALRRGRD